MKFCFSYINVANTKTPCIDRKGFCPYKERQNHLYLVKRQNANFITENTFHSPYGTKKQQRNVFITLRDEKEHELNTFQFK
jgi:hypothetical protein